VQSSTPFASIARSVTLTPLLTQENDSLHQPATTPDRPEAVRG
jgi:hypothetical protein